MVNQPSWGSFPTPEDYKEESEHLPYEQQEQMQEFSGGMEDESSVEKPQWGNFLTPDTYQGEDDPTENESPLDYFARNIATNSSRLGEQYFGRSGNVEKVSKDILSNFPLAGGLLGWGMHKLMGQERWERMIRGKPGYQQILPTSEQLKQLSFDLTEGYTKPKTPGEEHFQKYVEDIGATLNPTRGFNTRNVAVNNLGIPIMSNVVADIIEGLGWGKTKAMIGKLGTWLGLSLLGNVNAPNFAADLTNQGRNGIPANANYDTVRMLNRLDQVERTLLHADPRMALARQQVGRLRDDIANGQNSIRSLMTQYDGTNAAKRSSGLFEMNRPDREFARINIDRVLHSIRDEIRDAGAAYPQALESWTNGIQAWAVIHQSRAITNTIDRWARGPYAKILGGPAAALFGVGTYQGIKTPLVSIPLTAATPIAYKTAQVGYRTWNDPRLARYYWDAILDAQRENAPAFIKNYIKLNEGLEKSSRASKKNKKKSKSKTSNE